MHSTTLLIVLAILPFLFDMQNGLSWWRGLVIEPKETADEDYTILVPVFGSPRYFSPAEREALGSYKDRIIVVMETSAPDMDEFAYQLHHEEGWRVWTCKLADSCSPRLMFAALDAGIVTTSYVIRMDADSRTYDNIGNYIAAIREDGADVVSAKVHVLNPKTLPEKFQAIEYRMAMLARHYRPMLTSGACYIAKTDVLRFLLAKHTYWWCGEDVEVGMLAKAHRMRVRHIDMEVLTGAPSSWLALWRQRRLWWCANFRHAIVNMDKNAIHRPMWTLYYVTLVWFGVVFKWNALAFVMTWQGALGAFLVMWVIYIAVTLAGNFQVRSWWMIVFPPYAFLQAMLMPWVGLAWYFVMVRKIGNTGRYHFGYLKHRYQAPTSLAAEKSLQIGT